MNAESNLSPRLSISRKRNFSSRLSFVEDNADQTLINQKRPTPDLQLARRSKFETEEEFQHSLSVRAAYGIPRVSFTNVSLLKVFNPEKEPEYLTLKNDETIHDFLIIGTGNPTKAVHKPSGEVFIATAFDATDALRIRRIIHRLDNARIYYDKSDCEELSNCVLPPESEFCQSSQNRYVLFTPSEKKSVHTFATERSDQITETEVIVIFRQLVRLVYFCHTIGLLIRDIKPKKFLFFNNNGKTQLRLDSIQEMVVLDDPENDQIKERFGSPAYVPPEVLVLDRKTGTYSGKSADIWGMGVFLYMLFCGKYPFYDSTPAAMFRKIRRAIVIFPLCYIDKTNKDLVLSLLKKEPKDRLSAEQLLKDKYYSCSDIRCRSKALINYCEILFKIETTQTIRRQTANITKNGLSENFINSIMSQLKNLYQEASQLEYVISNEQKEVDAMRRAKFDNGPIPPYAQKIIDWRMRKLLKLIYEQDPLFINLLRRRRKLSETEPINQYNLVPFELLLPPEVYPPRPSYHPLNDPIDYRCMILLRQNNCLQFPVFEKGKLKTNFERRIEFTGTPSHWTF